ncbi:PAS domain S-box protein [Chloroflexus sp.]|uniref:PAS domain S-box protein n=1 Tax=Chloroflexus sp. TaxID=1904827 RepID=UPI00298ED3AE|nr:PAS domain S-box protein [Chloroflexus sp.]MDW8404248.1 PAS domain S-box protein [Chloroflexus sp.]
MIAEHLAIVDALRALCPTIPPPDRPLLVALADALSTNDPSHLLALIRNGDSISSGFLRLDATRRQATKLLSDQPAAAGLIADIIAAAQQVLIAEEETLLRREHMLNQRLEQSFLTSPLATIEADEYGIITRWNPAAERIFGWSAAEAIGKNAIELLVPNIAREHVEGIVKALLSGQATNSRNANITKDGRIIICQWYNAVLYHPDGRVAGWLSQTEDITEQIRAEEALRESQRRLDSLIRNLPGIAYRVRKRDRSWFAEFLSEGTIEVTGYPARDFIATEQQPPRRRFPDLIVPEDYQAVRESVRAALAQQRQYEITYRIYHADGSIRWVWERGAGVFDDQGRLLAIEGFISDITAERQAAEERQALNERIIAAQQAALRELSTPIVPISHGVIAMPLIGSIDSIRAQQVIETLLEGVSTTNAQIVILDITGVAVVDTQVANALLRSAQAVRLLGAEVLLTGIRPEVAQTIVGLGLDLSNIRTLASLQDGISYALSRQDKLRARSYRSA